MPKKQLIEVEGREFAISNVEKVYFPESGFTKGEVIAFYSEIAIADVILPHLRDRPLTLKRRHQQSFQKCHRLCVGRSVCRLWWVRPGCSIMPWSPLPAQKRPLQIL